MKNENKVTIKNKKIMIHKFSRYLLTLVALLTMTTGAWAQTQITITQGFEDGMGDWTMNHCEGNTGIKSGFAYEGSNCFRFYYTTNYPQYLISPELDENDGGTMSFYYARESSNYTESFKVGYSTTTSEPSAFTWGNQQTVSNGDGGDFFDYTYNFPAGTKYVSIACTSPDQFYLFIDDIKIEYAPAAPAGPVVEISDDQTSAEFDMPSYDATLEYQIVRNLASNTTLNLFIGTDAVTADARLRIKKDGSAYIPVSALSFTLTDAPEGGETTTLTAAQALAAKLNPVYELKGEGDDNWTVVTINETTHLPQTLAPGQTYRVSLVAADDAPLYGGEVQAQYTVTLFEGYEVTVPAGEYITYYRDEPLMVDKTQQPYAELYTISEVGTETATLSGPYDAMKTLTPMLVFNSSDDAQTILLIPCNEPDLAVTVAPEFKGTLEATEIAASDATSNNYAFNGKQFVWVKNDLAVGQYKAWLEVPVSTSNARALTLVFGDATGLKAIENGQLTIDNWYDLNGRKLNAMPTKKGVYIMNGKKVVVK